MDKTSLRWGFVLILFAMLGAFLIPVAAIPRLALSAHTVGLLSGLLLIAFGAITPALSLEPRHFSLTRGLWIYSGFANWLGCLLGSIWGAGTMTPVASKGLVSSPLNEQIISGLLGSVALTALVAVCLTLYGLKAQK